MPTRQAWRRSFCLAALWFSATGALAVAAGAAWARLFPGTATAAIRVAGWSPMALG